jgi:hypothetical protein
VFVVGDFNEQDGDRSLGTAFSSVPGGLPDSYRLGDDITLPLAYQPFARLTDLGLTVAHPRWEDSDRDSTFNETSRLDYLVHVGATWVADEVYNACQDNGVDDDPPGGWIPKRGRPLACYSAIAASDHLPVVGDFLLP